MGSADSTQHPIMTDDPNVAPAVRTADPYKVAVVYKAEISDNARYLYFCCSMNCCCWDMVKKRTYAHVMENRLESNYPICLLCCLTDVVTVRYFDQIGVLATASRCTPFHLCCCIQCCGGVAATASCDAVNNACCTCCRYFYPGLSDPDKFVEYATQAMRAYKEGRRLIGPPSQFMN